MYVCVGDSCVCICVYEYGHAHEMAQRWPEDSIGTGPYLRQSLLVVIELLYIRTQ